MSEVRDVPGWPGIRAREDGAVIGRSGRVISGRAGRYIPVPVTVDGRKTTVGAHVLVALAFLGPQPDGHEVAHENGNTHDNRPTNLRWSTHADNCADKVAHGTVQHGERNPNRKLAEQDVREMRAAHTEGVSTYVLAARYGVTRQNVGFIVRRETWRHVS